MVAALWMNVFLRKCDVLKIACLAQIVNVIAPILTRPDGLVRQTIFHAFKLFRRHAAGRALDLVVDSPRHATKRYGDIPLVDVSASYDQATGITALFLVNRSRTEPVAVECLWQDRPPARIVELQRLAGLAPDAVNTFDNPDRVVPRKAAGPAVRDGVARLTLPPLSFTVATAR